MIDRKREDEMRQAEILECIQLDASSILKPDSSRYQIISGGLKERTRRTGVNDKTRKEVPYGKNIVAG